MIIGKSYFRYKAGEQMDILELIQMNTTGSICLYGLGTETERFLNEYGSSLTVAGLLDGFREDGEAFGYPILSLQEAKELGVDFILVIARPGSCKAIGKRIGSYCLENGITLYDVRGCNLLEEKKVSYDFSSVKDGITKQELSEKIARADVVSFDLFDTLVMRKTMSYTDVFELLGQRLRKQGILIPGFAALRLAVEKELSKHIAPTLEAIYTEVLKRCDEILVSADELAKREWELDVSLIVPRDEVCEVFRQTVALGKKVYITTDTYYSREQIALILERFSLTGYHKVFVSCECGTAKTQGLFDLLFEENPGARVLHVGDDVVADIEAAKKRGFDTCKLYSAVELFDALGDFGVEGEIISLADRVKTGLFLAQLFRNPFQFEAGSGRVGVADAYDIGYLFCAPIVTDFLFWLRGQLTENGLHQMLFCARDGYLPEQMYKKIDEAANAVYFLTSRTAAIRAGLRTAEDISYVDSMKYFGSEEESLKVRYGIQGKAMSAKEREDCILRRAAELRDNYRKYIMKQALEPGTVGLFDFVAKGTTQLYLGNVLEQHLKGFYFLQLEPEFMADKGLDIVSFYSNEERDKSSIFNNYYILETVLTSPYPSVAEFDKDGVPVFSEETRKERDVKCVLRAQKGIVDFFDDLLSVLPEEEWIVNKKLSEAFLSLVNSLEIRDGEFLELVVEDPFFGRMTDIKDMIG